MASNSPFTWPTTNIESDKTSTAFPPIFRTMVIPTNRTSYLALLFVAEKPNLKDFSMVIFLRDIRTSLTPNPFLFVAPSMYSLQDKGSYK